MVYSWRPPPLESVPITTAQDDVTRVNQERLYNAPEEWQYGVQMLQDVLRGWTFVDSIGIASLETCRKEFTALCSTPTCAGARVVKVSRYLTSTAYGKVLIHSIVCAFERKH